MMEDQRRGELMGLLASAKGAIEAAMAALRAEGPKKEEPAPAGECPHDILRPIGVFGDDGEGAVHVCGRCGDLVES